MIWICELYEGQGPLSLLILKPHLTGSISHWTDREWLLWDSNTYLFPLSSLNKSIRHPVCKQACGSPAGFLFWKLPESPHLPTFSFSLFEVCGLWRFGDQWTLSSWNLSLLQTVYFGRLLGSTQPGFPPVWKSHRFCSSFFPASHHGPYGSHGDVVEAQRRPDWLWTLSHSPPLRGPPAFFHSSPAWGVP